MEASDPLSSQIPHQQNANPRSRISNPLHNIYTNSSHPSYQEQSFTQQLHPQQQPRQGQHLDHPQSFQQQQHRLDNPAHYSYQTQLQQRQTTNQQRVQQPSFTVPPPLPTLQPTQEESRQTPQTLRSPQPRSSLLISQSDSKLLARTYSDFLEPLKSYQAASDWILQWVFASAFQPIQDISKLNIDMSRGFRSLHMCGSQNCASLQPSTILQNVSTLLLPAESRGSVVCGYYTETSTDQVSSIPSRTGKYVFCPDTQELMTISKVSNSAPHLLTICISRTCLVANGMFVKDDTTVSFPWQNYSGRVPEHYMVHTRTLSLHKLLQTAHLAGIDGHITRNDLMGLGDNSGDFPLSENSFLGLGPFGLYDVALLTPTPAYDAQRAVDDPVELSTGLWSVPEHSSVCHAHQFLYLGMFSGDLSAMRVQFARIYEHPGQGHRQGHVDASSGLDESLLIVNDTVISSGPQPVPREPLSQGLPHSTHAFPTDPIAYGDKNIVPNYASLPMGAPTSQPIPFNSVSQQIETNVMTTDTRRQDFSGQMAATAVSIPLGPPSSLVLPIQRQIPVVPSGQVYHGGVEEALEGVPSTLVESIDAAVAAQTPGAAVNRVHASPPSIKYPPVVPYVPVVTSNSVHSGAMKGPTIPLASTSTFKKTLPAPTKSEIVIRNRISAQRSNEKRRKKIEATKNELQYLKQTYVPYLERRRGSLSSENHSLRMRLMERYNESDIESFF